MKKSFLLVTLFFIQSLFLSAQNLGTITGKLVDQNGNSISVGLQLQLYISSKVYSTYPLPDGTFTFNNVSNVKDEQLPTGYSVSDNYPNPFNPRTRIGITLPNSGSVRTNVYNLLGQRVCDEIEKYFSAGESYIDLELNGLPNGFYLARITLNEKYSVIKKLMLIYGSQHLSSSVGVSNFRLNKSALDARIDSLVVTGPSIARKVFTNLPNFTGSPLDLGNLIVTRFAPSAPILSSPANGSTNLPLVPTLSWNASSGATSYTLQVSTNNLFSSNVSNIGGYPNTSCPVNGLNYSTTYYWRISATNSVGTSDWSTIWLFTIQASTSPPSAPILMGPGDGDTSLSTSPSLVWNASSGATSYALQVSTNNLFSSYIFNQSGLTNTSQQISGLSNSTTYYWRVSATNSYGTSNWSLIRSFTTMGVPPPSPPTLISPSNGLTNVSASILLMWGSSSGATSYTLQVSTNSSFSTGIVFNQNVGNNFSQQITGLNYSTTYYWRVSATNNNGTSQPSSPWSFTTITQAQCPGVSPVNYAGKVYNTVQIGNQCWLSENLDVGNMIQGSENQSNNSSIEKYCYNNDLNNCTTYGGLYMWNEAMQYSTAAGTKGICPTGWHIPTQSEFQTLSTTVSGNGNSLKAAGQGILDGIGTNTSDFSALLAGMHWSDGNFQGITGLTTFWSSTEIGNPDYANRLGLVADNSIINLDAPPKNMGYSIRCIKD